MNGRLADNRGIALIVVLLALTVIIAFTVEFNRSARSEIYDAANFRDRVELLYAAKSGFALAQAELLADTNDFDALTEDWAKPLEDKDVNSADIRVSIEDESGKIPVNLLLSGNAYNPDMQQMLLRLLSLPEFRLSQERVEEILASLKDWMDSDNEVTVGGAESDYYLALPRPYACKNASLDRLEELLMVKGITKELYYGTADTPGLVHCLTVYGEGRININTAPITVLQVLGKDTTAAMAEQLDEYRRSQGSNLTSPDWYRKIGSWSGVSIKADLISTKSNYYAITVTGSLGSMRERVTGVIKRDREQRKILLLSWEAD